ncbi:MAG: hypothetical protein JWR60_2094 [Polaromonas sp.]|nr:hypothetical protein [Polaromonas sp.]
MNMAHNATNTAFNAEDSRQLAAAYPASTSDIAGDKFRRFNDKAHALQAKAARQIAREPVKAAALGVAAGGLLAALVMRRWRGGQG